MDRTRSRLKIPSAIPTSMRIEKNKENSKPYNTRATRKAKVTGKSLQPWSRNTRVSSASRTSISSRASINTTRRASSRQSSRAGSRSNSRPGSGSLANLIGSKRTSPSNTPLASTNSSPEKKMRGGTLIIEEGVEDLTNLGPVEMMVERYFGGEFELKRDEYVSTKIPIQKFKLKKYSDDQRALLRKIKKLLRGFVDRKAQLRADIREEEAKRKGEMDQRIQQVENLEKLSGDLKERLQKAEERRTDIETQLRGQIDTLSESCAQSKTATAILEQKVQEAASQKEAWEKEKSSLALLESKLKEEVSALQEQLHAKKDELNSQIQSMKKQERSAEMELLKFTQMERDLKKQYDDLKAQGQKDLEELRSKYDRELEDERRKIASSERSVTSLQEEIKSKEQSIGRLESEIRDTREKIQSLQSEVHASEKSATEIKMGKLLTEAKVQELKMVMQQQEKMFDQSREHLTEMKKQLEKAHSEVKDYKERADELMKKNQENQQMRFELENKCRESLNLVERERDGLKRDLEDVKLRKEGLEEEAKKLRGAMSEHTSQMNKIMAENNELKREVDMKSIEISSLQKMQVENVADSNQQQQMQRLMDMTMQLETQRAELADKESLNKELDDLRQENDRLKQQMFHAEMTRRELHNQIQDLKGNIRVMVRVRPFLSHDGENVGTPIRFEPDSRTVLIQSVGERSKKHRFKFDHVFRFESTQAQCFEEVSALVQSALDGYNVCLFSYGQTGSGKTHTMQGSPDGEMRGMIPRSIEKVLEQASRLKQQGWQYVLRVSFLEIYNETIRDLLGNNNNNNSKGQKAGGLEIKLSKSRDNVEVVGLTKVEVKSMEAVADLIVQANKARSVAATKMNIQSSRSHSVFTMYLTGTNKKQGLEATGQLHLCDLAGSERLSRSQVTGDRLKETQAINKSLSCLSDVFFNIAQKSPHIPYRNSKLTYLLQNCFGKDGKTMMFVNLSPTMQSQNETICSLRFASKVNQCQLGKPTKQVKRVVPASAPVSPAKVRGGGSMSARQHGRSRRPTIPRGSMITSHKRGMSK